MNHGCFMQHSLAAILVMAGENTRLNPFSVCPTAESKGNRILATGSRPFSILMVTRFRIRESMTTEDEIRTDRASPVD